MSSPRVLIGPAQLKGIPHVFDPALRAAGLEPVFPAKNVQMTEAELAAQLPGCAASLAGSEPYTRAVIAAAAERGLRVIARAGVGYDGVDLAAATDFGIAVANAPGTNHEAVGEHALMLALAVLRSLIPQHLEITRDGKWPRRSYRPLRGNTFGIVGLGRTGKATALRAKAFGVTLVATEPVPDHAFVAANGITLVPLDQLLRTADVVSLHVPLTPETRRLIRAETLAVMKPTAVLVNTSRGEVVDEADLHAALTGKRLFGAGLDVFGKEPPGANALFALPNVIATAHTAGIDTGAIENMGRVAADAVVRLLAGDWPTEYVVNPAVKDRFLGRTV